MMYNKYVFRTTFSDMFSTGCRVRQPYGFVAGPFCMHGGVKPGGGFVDVSLSLCVRCAGELINHGRDDKQNRFLSFTPPCNSLNTSKSPTRALACKSESDIQTELSLKLKRYSRVQNKGV